MNSFLLTLAACIALLLGAAYIAPNYIEWNEYRDVFEDQASRVIGREVRVEGNVNLKLLPAPYLEFHKVKILDKGLIAVKGQGVSRNRPLFVEVEAFKLWLAIPPLLQGNIKVRKLELADPHVFLRFDQNGQANWKDLGVTEGIDAQYLPNQVAFDSVNITRGTISVFQYGSSSSLQLASVNGELSAASLQGPYRVSGQFSYQGEERRFNLSTGKQDDLGVLRIKSVIEVPKTGSRYITEGDLHGFAGIPTFKGNLQGELPLALLSTLDGNAAPGVKLAAPTEGNLINIRSDVSASLKRVELKELTISVEDQKRPQSINGLAILDWNNGFNVNTRLKASWLDLDQMLGAGPGALAANENVQKLDRDSVTSAFGLFIRTLQDMGSHVSRAAVHAEVADARLGGSQVGNFEFHLTKNLEQFRIAKLSLQLPGRNQLDLSGELTPDNDNLSFAGPVSIKGISLGALSHWVAPKSAGKTVFESNPYFLQGNISYSPVRFEIRDLRGDLNGAGVAGLFRYDYSERKEFALELDSDKVDLKDIVSKDATIRSLMLGMMTGKQDVPTTDGPSASKQEGNSFIDTLSGLQGRINLRIGRIEMPEMTGRDVVIDGQLGSGQFALKSFSMMADDSLRVSGKGQIRNLNSDAQGNLRFSVEADNAKGLHTLARQFDMPESVRQNERLLGELSPLRLAITLNMHSGGLPSTDISIAGTAAKSQITVNARHEGAIGTFGSRQLDVSGTLINPESSALISQFVRTKMKKNINEAGQGAFSIQASGIPENGLETRARLDAGSTQAGFNGNISFRQGSGAGQGQIEIKSSDASAALSLLGLDQTAGFAGEPIKLSASLIKKKDIYNISNILGKIGSVALNGDSKIDMAAEPVRVDFSGSVTEGSLPGMLSWMVPSILPDDLQQVVNLTGAQLETSWSNRPFDTRKFKSVQGKLDLRFERMALASDVVLNNGELRATLSDGALTFNRLKGQLYNGPFSASGSLVTGNGPVAMKASMSLEGADIAEMFKSSQNRSLARGEAAFSLSVSGQGLSPLGLVSEMNGKGNMNVIEGEIFDFSPDALQQVVSASGAKVDDKTLSENFRKSLQGNSFPLRNLAGRISVKSGVVSLTNISFSAGTTTAQTTTLLELASMKLDSEWLLTGGSRQSGNLPGVRLVFAGPMSKITTIPPAIDMGQLRQTLAVKQIEKDFDTLKKLEARDPETIRRLQNQATGMNAADQNRSEAGQEPIKQPVIRESKPEENRFVSIPDGRPLSEADVKRELSTGGNRTDGAVTNTDEKGLPALTNLGTIDQGGPAKSINGQIGADYSYEKTKIEGLQQPASGSLPQGELAEEIRKKLEEKERNVAAQPKKKSQKSFFERIFGGDTGG